MRRRTAPDRTLLFAGIDHRRTPVELRERYTVPGESLHATLAALHATLGPVALLSTCGRVELYADVSCDDSDRAARQAVAWFASRGGASDAGTSIETARGADALRRLVRVACGLESAVEGEDEILGQVRRAWLAAGHAGTLSATLDAACRLAVRTGRLARRHGSRDGWTSLADSAAGHILAGLNGRATPMIVVAGTGPMGLRATETLRGHLGDAPRLVLAGRTPARVEAAAARLDAQPLTLAALPAALDQADATIVALRTRAPLLAAAQIAPRTPQRPLVIADLSLPRAVEPAVGALPHVTLVDVDTLGGAGHGHRRWNEEDRVHVERLVERTVGQYDALIGRSDAAETLATLRMQADGIRRAQLERTFQRLPHLDAEARWTVDALTRAIVNRLLHAPTMHLKSEGADEAAIATRRIFGLE
jgi:glutamyl-tRNA reductase